MDIEKYDYKAIESKWQKFWEGSNAFKTSDTDPASSQRKKFYCLVMFPYPSGKIHMGHARNYCIGDVIARYKKMCGYEVLHPIGWDAFGLPAENAAIEHHIHPLQWTKQNIRDMKRDIQSLGISYDWDREFATCDPDYYCWNQWFFIQMYKKGLAFKKKSAVNWCVSCKTVLANEQVHDGNCWRCKTPVTQKELDQWFLKITDYAEKLLNDLKLLEGKWPDEVLLMQRNWIGRSEGTEIDFPIVGEPQSLKVFTTRPDTLFGCTFLVLSPEHPRIQKMQSPEVSNYCEKAKRKSKLERTSTHLEKTGVFTGSYALNPVNGKQIPIWVADYVLSDYGTGAIMSVPAHDSRDFEFAKKYNLPILEVIHPKDTTSKSTLDKAFEEEGILIHSDSFSGLDSKTAQDKISLYLEQKGCGKRKVTYRLRDWLISRQRYWGTPIPMISCPNCRLQPVPEKDLPVLLPEEVLWDIQANSKNEKSGGSPLAQIKKFVQVNCPNCGHDAHRETDTMDTFMDSSWYYLRYCDPKNEKMAFEPSTVNRWVPIDQYIGGIEHACMHLVYSRFFYKVIQDLGLIQSSEPFSNLLTQGMVTLGGTAMSKSKGNIVAVEEMVQKVGADAARLFILFASPPRNQLEWSEEGVQGAWRFLNRVWKLGPKIFQSQSASVSQDIRLLRKTHQTIQKVQEDVERDFQFNTAIASLMELLNTLSAYPHLGDSHSRDSFKVLLLLLYPFCPHIVSEMWSNYLNQMGTLSLQPFPTFDPQWIEETQTEIVIQVNGKLKGKITVSMVEIQNEEKMVQLACDFLKNKNSLDYSQAAIRYVPGKIINFVTEKKKEEIKNV